MRKLRLIIITVAALVVLVGLGSSSAIVVDPGPETTAYTHDNLLRLHVIANSNLLADQKLKRLVRDKVIAKTENLFKGVNDAKEARKIVKKNLDYIKQMAKDELNSLGSDYQVKVKLGDFYFPKRTYGNRTLIAGNYNALKIIVGQGQGENWWCVLFPPFCYIDSVNKETKESLETIKEEDFKIEIKSKFMEYLDKYPQVVKRKERLKESLVASVTDFNNLVSNMISDK
jgi:stage II sporulation protein R